MAIRDAHLQAFFDAAGVAFDEFAQNPASRRSLARIFAALEQPAAAVEQVAERLPVASEHLAYAAAPETFSELTLHLLATAFARIEPRLSWRRKDTSELSASENFAEGHANAMIAGPVGLEPRTDVWLGVTMLAPHVRYPDHGHPPEETYLVMSDGEFSQDGGPWFRPGVGGSFYNEPGITHAMRSLEDPLLAFWALWAKPFAS